MANPSTLYRFRIDLSDVDRSVYQLLDFRVPMHPSETVDYLLTRVLAYALNFEDGLVLLPGHCAGDEPAIHLPGAHGGIEKWIDIGNPSARRIHRASKASRQVRIYTYKNPELLVREAQGESIHRASEIELYSLAPGFLRELASRLERDNEWALLHQEGELTVSVGDQAISGSLGRHSLA